MKILTYASKKAPEVHEKKNQERNKLEVNPSKRKYCRFNPKIDLNLSLLKTDNFIDWESSLLYYFEIWIFRKMSF